MPTEVTKEKKFIKFVTARGQVADLKAVTEAKFADSYVYPHCHAKGTYTEKSRLLTHHIMTTTCYTHYVDIPNRPRIPYICDNVCKVA